MDHEWGRNIVEYSLASFWEAPALWGGLEPTLAARILSGPLTGLFLINNQPGGNVRIVQHVPDTELVVTFSYPITIIPGTHFPYGFDVEADGPV